MGGMGGGMGAGGMGYGRGRGRGNIKGRSLLYIRVSMHASQLMQWFYLQASMMTTTMTSLVAAMAAVAWEWEAVAWAAAWAVA